MNRLKELIVQSRSWTSIDRGRTLWFLVQQVLQNTFGVEAGMFIYQMRFLSEEKSPKVQVYAPWGLGYSESDLAELIQDSADFLRSTCITSECWLRVNEAPTVWKKVWSEAGIEYIGAWPIIVKDIHVGAMVLGRKTAPDGHDADLMSVCATYVSFVLEMLTLRRIAEHASHHDPLTKILNRRGFAERFNQLANESEKPLLIGVLDVNDFKSINDSFGHMAGDYVLADVGLILQTNLRDHGFCGRIGGDEFVFVLQDGGKIIGDITVHVASWFSNRQYTVSIGYAIFGVDGTDWDSCFQIADKRLYNRKTELTRN